MAGKFIDWTLKLFFCMVLYMKNFGYLSLVVLWLQVKKGKYASCIRHFMVSSKLLNFGMRKSRGGIYN